MLVTVATFTEPWEAHIFRLRLEAEGMFAVVAHEHHVWANWPYAMALGGVKVQVPPSELERALAVERRCRAGDYRAELEAEFGQLDGDSCPRCGARQVTSRRSMPQLALLIASAWFAGLIFPLRSSVHRCGSCRAKWHDRDDGTSSELAR